MNCGRHRLLARHARERGPAAWGHQCLCPSGSKAPCASFLGQEEIKPHEGALLSGTPPTPSSSPMMAEVSVCLPRGPGPEKSRCQGGEIRRKPGRDRLLTTRSLRNPGHRHDGHRICRQCQCRHASFARDQEYKRHGTLQACWPRDRSAHRQGPRARQGRPPPQPRVPSNCTSKLLDAAYPEAQHRDQADPRQSFHAHFEGNPSASGFPTLAARPLRLYLHAQAIAPGSNLIEGFFST